MKHKLRNVLRLGITAVSIMAIVVTLLPATAFATGTLDQSQPETSTSVQNHLWSEPQFSARRVRRRRSRPGAQVSSTRSISTSST